MIESGNLQHFKLGDLINILGQSKKTGVLKITSRTKGNLFFQEGILVHAEGEALNGEELVYELMSSPSGSFEFIEKEISVDKTINKDTDQLIKEGSFRVELMRLLAKEEFVRDPDSEIILLENNLNFNFTKEEEAFISNLKKFSSSSTIKNLAENSGLSLDLFVDILRNLIVKNVIELKRTKEEIFWNSFQTFVNTFYYEFTSISGLKMTNDINKKIQDLLLSNSWNLIFKDGKIYSSDMFCFPVEEQWKIYKSFLNELLDHFDKVYGNSFINKVTNKLLENNKDMSLLLSKLNRNFN